MVTVVEERSRIVAILNEVLAGKKGNTERGQIGCNGSVLSRPVVDILV